MQDKDLMELIDIIREIPREHWELFGYIRSMDSSDIERLKDLIQPKIPVPDDVADAIMENEEHDVEMGKVVRSQLGIDELRKFL